jgi:hypothetical protein
MTAHPILRVRGRAGRATNLRAGPPTTNKGEDDLRDAVRDELQPRGPVECYLVDRITSALRVLKTEPASEFDAIMQDRNRLERGLYQALEQLGRLQAHRRAKGNGC